MEHPLLQAHGLSCSRPHWRDGNASSFENISLEILPGERVCFVGPNGCGKGLLLNVLGLLEEPDFGTLSFAGTQPFSLPPLELARMRNQTVGFVFHSPNLLPTFSILENVAMPFFRICKVSPDTAHHRAKEILEFCGLWSLRAKLAGKLGLEEAAATAVARALMHTPRLLVAINPPSPQIVLPLLSRASQLWRMALLAAGSEEATASFFPRLLRMSQGKIVA